MGVRVYIHTNLQSSFFERKRKSPLGVPTSLHQSSTKIRHLTAAASLRDATVGWLEKDIRENRHGGL